jgi:transglutaminase-like putative cysteine protease
MDRILKFRETVILSIIAAILSFAVSSAAVQYLDIDPWMLSSYWKIFFTIIVSFALWMLIFSSRKAVIYTSAIIGAAVLIFMIIWFRGNFSEEFMRSFSAFFSWLGNFIFRWRSISDILPVHALIITLGITSLISLFMYWFVVRLAFYYPVLLLSMAIFVAQWAIYREVHKTAFYLTIAMLIILYFIGIYIGNNRKIRKAGEKSRFLDIPGFMAAAVPVVSLVLILVLLIPKSPDPIEWKWLDDRIKYKDLGGDKPIDFKSFDSFSLSATGFSSDAGRLGGSVTLDMSHMLDVYSDEPLYLRGESWPYFNGSMWGTVSDEASYAELLMDYPDYAAERQMLLEPVYGWRFIDLHYWMVNHFQDSIGVTVLPGVDFNTIMGEHLLPDWYDIKKVEINYAGVETKTMFTPLYSVLTNYDELKPVYAETDGTYDTDRTIRLYTVLDYNYLSLDRQNPYFLEAIKSSKRGIYEDLLSRLYFVTYNADAYDNIRITNSMDSTLRDLYELSQKSDIIYWRYTNLPEDLPQRVVSLAMEITEDIDNDYERVTAIEEYLSDNNTYSLTVEDVPEGRNFVDWFLFDTKEGYCTYYATAMTTMVRSIGLPARYVEGFATPFSATEGNRYAVLNSNAHAWVEVYFEGIGWLPFEPTSPYNLVLSSVRTGNPDDGEFIPDDPAFDPHADELDKEDVTEFPGITGGDVIPEDKGMSSFGITLIVIGGYLFINFMVYISRILFFKSIKTRGQFKRGYQVILRMLKIKGIRSENGITLMEHAQRIDETFYMGKVSMKDLTKTYYMILYSEESIDSEAFTDMQIFFRDFRKELDNELRMWELLIFRILLPLI